MGAPFHSRLLASWKPHVEPISIVRPGNGWDRAAESGIGTSTEMPTLSRNFQRQECTGKHLGR